MLPMLVIATTLFVLGWVAIWIFSRSTGRDRPLDNYFVMSLCAFAYVVAAIVGFFFAGWKGVAVCVGGLIALGVLWGTGATVFESIGHGWRKRRARLGRGMMPSPLAPFRARWFDNVMAGIMGLPLEILSHA
jgi:hypothetical protein